MYKSVSKALQMPTDFLGLACNYLKARNLYSKENEDFLRQRPDIQSISEVLRFLSEIYSFAEETYTLNYLLTEELFAVLKSVNSWRGLLPCLEALQVNHQLNFESINKICIHLKAETGRETLFTMQQLRQHPIFTGLKKVQSYLDSKDDTLLNQSMTRSPDHLLAFLIIMYLTPNKDKALNSLIDIMQKNSIVLSDTEQAALTVADLTQLVSTSICWHTLIHSLGNRTSSLFTILTPQNSYDYVSQHEDDDAFFGILMQYHLIKASKHPDEFKVITNVEFALNWKEPFGSVVDPIEKKPSFIIPGRSINLTSALQAKLATLPAGTDKLSQIGSFIVRAVERESSFPGDTYRVYLQRPDLKEPLQLQLGTEEQPLVTGNGVYQSFMFCCLPCSLPIIDIQVYLNGKALLSEAGLGVSQTQKVEIYCGAAGSHRQKLMVRDYDIVVQQVHACVAEMGLNFPSVSEQAIEPSLEDLRRLTFSLNSTTKTNVVVYPIPVTSLMAIGEMGSTPSFVKKVAEEAKNTEEARTAFSA